MLLFGNAISNGKGNFSNCAGMRANALLANTGIKNTGIGDSAGNAMTSGYNNTTIGFNAQIPTAGGNNQVHIGDAFVAYAGVQVPWTVTSDRIWFYCPIT